MKNNSILIKINGQFLDTSSNIYYRASDKALEQHQDDKVMTTFFG